MVAPSGTRSQAVSSGHGPVASADSRMSARALRDSLPNLQPARAASRSAPACLSCRSKGNGCQGQRIVSRRPSTELVCIAGHLGPVAAQFFIMHHVLSAILPHASSNDSISTGRGTAGAPVSLPERECARLPHDDCLGHGGRGAVRQRRGSRLAGGAEHAHAGRVGQASRDNHRPRLCDSVGHCKAPVALVRHGACASRRLSAPAGAQLRTEPESGVARGV